MPGILDIIQQGIGATPTGTNPLLDVLRGPAQQPVPAPGIDLGKISVQGPAQPQQAQPVVPPPMPQPAQDAVSQQPQQESGGFDIMNFLKQIGIPLATAGIGMGVPGALAGAAGFQTGFTEKTGELDKFAREQEKLEQAEAKSKAAIEEKRVNNLFNMAIKLKDIEANSGISIGIDDLNEVVLQLYKLKYEEEPSEEALSKISKKFAGIEAKNETVTIEFSDGVKQEMTLEEAKKQGYTK